MKVLDADTVASRLSCTLLLWTYSTVSPDARVWISTYAIGVD